MMYSVILAMEDLQFKIAWCGTKSFLDLISSILLLQYSL